MTHPKFEKFFGAIRRFLITYKVPARVIFILSGLISTVWFLMRVIPKPQRAGYPCMQAAFPLMAGFVIWLLSISGSIAAFKIAKRNIKNQKYVFAASFMVVAIVAATFSFIQYQKKAEAADNYVANDYFDSNLPQGKAQGIHSGRVIWIHNPDATDENCANTEQDPYYSEDANDQIVIDQMVNDAVLKLTGEISVTNAWDAMFKHFNQKKGKGSVTYQNNETVFIKINQGTASWLAASDLSRNYAGWTAGYDPVAETSPFTIMSILRHLVHTKGIPQQNIIVADPIAAVYKHTYDYLSAEFPNVIYGDKKAANVSLGRTQIYPSMDDIIFYSDKGETMTTAVADKIYEEMELADYMINIAALKAHARSGFTLTAKNHFGSHTRDGATHLHPSLPAPENDDPTGPTVGYGKYRVFVDLMGHEKLGQNTLLYFVDGLWGGDEAVNPPCKFTSAPFNDDWSSSIFISLDQVALESVCFDILRTEFNTPGVPAKYRPHYFGADDYLHQAASSNNWPEGIIYDPEDDGTPLESLGVHEHWNSAAKRQYTRNLGLPKGIELLTIPETLAESTPFVAPEATVPPAFDGIADDACWETANWYNIDQVWIPYGGSVSDTDFKGRFKVMWNEEDNLMYYLVEIDDDVFVDGYVWPEGGYPDFDIVEIFIDEDKSGGKHVFDVSGTENAENAFSYHIAVNAPENGEMTDEKVVCDIAGFTWGNMSIPNYAEHLPDFAMRKSYDKYTYEFSMKVYNDTYVHGDPEASRVTLVPEKIMGMSVAYCDNDVPETARDNFFGSVWVTAARYNSHWEECSDYGKLKLVSAGGAIIDSWRPSLINDFETSVKCYPNPMQDNNLNVRFSETGSGNIDMRIYNAKGQMVKNIRTYTSSGEFEEKLNLSGLESGYYFLEIRFNNQKAVKKFMK